MPFFLGKFWFSGLRIDGFPMALISHFPSSLQASFSPLIIDQSTLSNLNGFDTPKKWQNISNDCYLTIGLALESIKNKEGQLVKLPLSDCNSLGTFSQQNSHSSKNLQKSPWKMTIRARLSLVPLAFGRWWYVSNFLMDVVK